MADERLIITWVLGLIATDGHVHKDKRLICVVSTVELDWAEQVMSILAEVQFGAKLYTTRATAKRNLSYSIYVNGSRFYQLVKDYGDMKFCSPRKSQIIQKYLGMGNTHLKYSEYEKAYLIKNYKHHTDKFMAKHLNRTWGSVQHRRLKMGLLKKEPTPSSYKKGTFDKNGKITCPAKGVYPPSTP